MNFLEIGNLVTDLCGGAIFTVLGLYMTVRHKKIVGALLESNKVFWGNFVVSQNSKLSMFITNMMISFMGIIFFLSGLLLDYKVLVRLFS